MTAPAPAGTGTGAAVGVGPVGPGVPGWLGFPPGGVLGWPPTIRIPFFDRGRVAVDDLIEHGANHGPQTVETVGVNRDVAEDHVDAARRRSGWMRRA